MSPVTIHGPNEILVWCKGTAILLNKFFAQRHGINEGDKISYETIQRHIREVPQSYRSQVIYKSGDGIIHAEPRGDYQRNEEFDREERNYRKKMRFMDLYGGKFPQNF